MPNPSVSVIVTAYNQAPLLEVTLSRLTVQSYDRPWEVVICDDGSQQDLLPMIRDLFRAPNPSVRYIWHSRSGPRRAGSRNNGLRCATGDIIILLDGDVAVGHDFVRAHAGHHRGGRTAVFGSRKWVFLKDLAPDTRLADVVERGLADPQIHGRLFTDTAYQQRACEDKRPWIGCAGCNLSFVRLEQILLDESFVGWGAEDTEFACRLHVRHKYKMTFDPSIWGLHLEDEHQADYTPIRPRTPEAIGSYLANLAHFMRLYPKVDMPELRSVLAYFSFDPATRRWSRAPEPDFHPENIKRLYAHMMSAMSQHAGR
jgi:glycosyltransferase involved in cell wall biosynthesis